MFTPTIHKLYYRLTNNDTNSVYFADNLRGKLHVKSFDILLKVLVLNKIFIK